MNVMRTAMLLAFMTALFMGIGFLIGGTGGMMIALVIAAGMNLFSYWNSDRMVLSAYHAQEVDARSAPEFYNMIRDLSANAGLPMPKVYVYDNPQPNAFATGRNPQNAAVAASTGLLQRLTHEEVAGVMAHELGHVKHRHTMRRIIQTGGTSFLIGLLFGDVTGSGAMIFVGKSIFDASYSRDSEREADAFAFDAMRKLGRSPKPMGEFLLRVTGTQASKSSSILATHPMTEDRLAAASKEDRPPTGEPILTAAEWDALKNICKAK